MSNNQCWSAILFVVLSDRSKDSPRSPLTVPVRWVACKGGLCLNPPSRVARLAGAPSLHVNRPLEHNFSSPTLVTNISWENKVLTSDPARQRQVFLHVNFVFVCVYSTRIYIFFSFTNEKGELTILTTKTRPFIELHNTESLVFWQPIMATTNLPSYKSENSFFDHRSEGHHGQLPSYSKDLFSYHNSWPFAVAELQNILSWWRRL